MLKIIRAKLSAAGDACHEAITSIGYACSDAVSSPGFVACAFTITGCSLLVGGVNILLGAGWALIVSAVPFLGAAWLLFRGMSRAE